MSRGNQSSRPMTGTLRRISVPSIGELFHAYPAATLAATNISLVSLSSAAIVMALFKHLWNFLTRKPLWFLLARISKFIFNTLHIMENTPLKGLPSFRITRWHIPSLRRTCCIKHSARVEAVFLGTGTTMKNCDISHITLFRVTSPLLSVKCPGNYKSAWRMTKGELTGHENITSWPHLLQL